MKVRDVFEGATSVDGECEQARWGCLQDFGIRDPATSILIANFRGIPMQQLRMSCWFGLAVTAVVVLGCDTNSKRVYAEDGGNAGSAGADSTARGGAAAKGGSTSRGGATASSSAPSGGKATAGGTSASGGASENGGSTNQATTVAGGGTTSVTRGGTTSYGGSTLTVPSGGTTTVGGSSSAGGVTTKGGSSSVSAGGTTTVGGSATRGGTSSVGGTSAAGGSTVVTCSVASTCTPSAPRLLSPLSTGQLSSRTPTFKWTASTPVQKYEVEICDVPTCFTTLTTLTATTREVKAPTALAAGKTFYWRVKAINDSFSTYSSIWSFTLGYRSVNSPASWLASIDVNLDGFKDVAFGSASNQVHVMLNGSAGLPTATPSLSVSGASGFGRALANAGDVDGDGYSDLIVGAFSAGTAYLHRGTVNGTAPTPKTILTGSSTNNFGRQVAGVGDINGDGYADVAIGDGTTAAASYLFLGTASGLSTTIAATLNGPVVAGAGDINGDGFNDVVVCSRMSHTATTYLGSATGLVDDKAVVAPAGATTTGFGEACAGLGDVNGDGYSDIIVANQSTASAYVFYGGVSGILATGPTLLGGASGGGFDVTTAIASAGDINKDGFSDVVIGGYNGNVVYVYTGTASGVSTVANTTISTLATGGYANSVAGVGDVSGDGIDDIAFAPSQCSGYPSYVYAGSATGINLAAAHRTWANPTGSQCPGPFAR